jgi:hypothetical protein
MRGVVRLAMAGRNPAIHGFRFSAYAMPGTSGAKTRFALSRHVFSAAFFGPNVDLMLSNSSTFTPFLRMM